MRRGQPAGGAADACWPNPVAAATPGRPTSTSAPAPAAPATARRPHPWPGVVSGHVAPVARLRHLRPRPPHCRQHLTATAAYPTSVLPDRPSPPTSDGSAAPSPQAARKAERAALDGMPTDATLSRREVGTVGLRPSPSAAVITYLTPNSRRPVALPQRQRDPRFEGAPPPARKLEPALSCPGGQGRGQGRAGTRPGSNGGTVASKKPAGQGAGTVPVVVRRYPACCSDDRSAGFTPISSAISSHFQ